MFKNIGDILLKACLTTIAAVVLSCFIPNPWKYPSEMSLITEEGTILIGTDILYFDVMSYGEIASVKYKGDAEIVLFSSDGVIPINDGDVLDNINSPIGFTVTSEKGNWNGHGTFEILKEGKKKSYHIWLDGDRVIFL